LFFLLYGSINALSISCRIRSPSFPRQSTAFGLATTLLCLARQIRLGRISLFVLARVRDIHAAAIDGEDQPTFRPPDSGERLGHPLANAVKSVFNKGSVHFRSSLTNA
jgi:hypothetical protein